MKNKYVDKFLKDINGKPKDYDRKLNKIEGVLFLFITFSILIIFFSLTGIANQIAYLKEPQLRTYAMLMLSFYIPAEVGLNIAMIVYMFKKNIVFRFLFVIYSAIVVVSMTAAFIYLLSYGTIYTTAIFRFVITALWIVYLYTSKRVKNTFIYPYTEYAKEQKKNLFEMKQEGR